RARPGPTRRGGRHGSDARTVGHDGRNRQRQTPLLHSAHHRLAALLLLAWRESRRNRAPPDPVHRLPARHPSPEASALPLAQRPTRPLPPLTGGVAGTSARGRLSCAASDRLAWAVRRAAVATGDGATGRTTAVRWREVSVPRLSRRRPRRASG